MSLYITQQSYETPIGSYGIACPAVNHYYQGGQTGALDTGVLCDIVCACVFSMSKGVYVSIAVPMCHFSVCDLASLW